MAGCIHNELKDAYRYGTLVSTRNGYNSVEFRVLPNRLIYFYILYMAFT